MERELPYIEALGRVEALRREGQIGAVRGGEKLGAAEAGIEATTRYPSMQSTTILSAAKPTRLGGIAEAPARVVAPTRAPTPVDLGKSRQALMDEAMRTAGQFRSAIEKRAAAEAAIAAKIGSGGAAAQEMPALAASQRAALQEVLNLAAQMREYGFVGSNEDLMTRFAPK
jgi:hypothetical protein